MSPKHVVSCSFGKDSIATILLALEHGEPLDEAVYCEVMFDDDTSGEVPEHQAFIYQAAIPALEKLGVPVRVLRSEKTYTSVFMGKVTRGPKKGMIRSFPVCGKCYVQRDCKMHPIRQYQKTLPSNTVQYIALQRMNRSVWHGWVAIRCRCWRNTDTPRMTRSSSANKQDCFPLCTSLPTAAAAGFARMPSCPSCNICTTIIQICGKK